jgi:hypothetical protein
MIQMTRMTMMKIMHRTSCRNKRKKTKGARKNVGKGQKDLGGLDDDNLEGIDRDGSSKK